MRSPLVALVAWLLVSLASVAQAQQQLRWKLESGQQLKLQLTQSTVTETQVGATPLRTSVELIMDVQWAVDHVDDQGTATIRQTVQRLQMVLEAASENRIKYDSEEIAVSQGQREVAAAVEPLLRMPLRFQMTDRGAITGVQVVRGDGQQGAVDGEQDGGRATQLMLSQDTMQEALRQVNPLLPEEPVEAGQQWTQQFQAPSAWGPLDVKTVSIYTGQIEHDGRLLSQLNLRTELQLQPSPAAAPLKISQQRQEGTILFDAEAGRLVKADVQQELVTQSQVGDRVLPIRLSATLKAVVE